MAKSTFLVFALVVAAILRASAFAQAPPPAPTVTPAVDGIFAAFEAHPLVGVGDAHGMAQEADFYATLIRDPRFARDVGNVVVEFGGAVHQDIIDRYLAGEAVPYTELRKVWTDVVGWFPNAAAYAGYLNFYAQVRAVNLSLAPPQRIHVWLGEPSIDWSKINTREDRQKIPQDRDAYPAEVIKKQILEKNKKALVIYGTGHWGPPLMPGSTRKFVRQIIEQEYPNAIFIVSPYAGFHEKACSADFERGASAWAIPALASPVRGSSLEKNLRRPGCHFIAPGELRFPPSMTDSQRKAAEEVANDAVGGVMGDAILYLGPAASLTFGGYSPDVYLDAEYRRELDRRHQLIFGAPMPAKIDMAQRPFQP